MEKLTIGMPAGSLADPKRGGNLIQLLHNAGFYTKGYESGGPSVFTTISAYMGWDGRPQEFGSQLGMDEIDVAIGGDDWIKERILEFKYEYNTDIYLEKVMSLKRGNVRIVGILNRDDNSGSVEDYIKSTFKSKGLITVVSELPYLALHWLKEKLRNAGISDEYKEFSVQKYKSPSKISKGILIYETWGKTEAKVRNGGADLGVEITQTGSALRNYGLDIVDEIMTSETGIWINPEMKQNKDKNDLLNMFLLNLEGALNAENKVLLLFNVANEDVNKVESYLKENKVFADEPTKNTGSSYTEFSLQVESKNAENPLPKVRYELAVRGAKNIDTIPLVSSIKSL